MSSFGNYKIGEKIKFLDDDGNYISGVIEQLTEHQVIVKPDVAGTKFYEGYRICLSRSELQVKIMNISSYEEVIVDEDGSVSI